MFSYKLARVRLHFDRQRDVWRHNKRQHYHETSSTERQWDQKLRNMRKKKNGYYHGPRNVPKEGLWLEGHI